MSHPSIYAFADEASPMMEGQIAAMLRNGLQGVEVRTVDGENVSAITPEKAKEVRKKLDGAGLTVWSVGSPIGKIDIEKDDFAAHLDLLRRTVDIAHILGTENIRMFSFYLSSRNHIFLPSCRHHRREYPHRCKMFQNSLDCTHRQRTRQSIRSKHKM